MTIARLNHVSVSAPNMDESVRFYVELFGMEELPAPNFGYPLRWLRVGDLQLHLYPRSEPRTSAHFALQVDDLVLDPSSREVRRAGRGIAVTATEFRLLEFLMRRVGQLINTEVIIDNLWTAEEDATAHNLRMCVNRLRSKLEDSKHLRLQTVYGMGYRWVE